MVTSFCVASSTVKKRTLVSIWTYAGSLVILGAIIISAIVEGAVPLSHRSSPPLVHKVPVEAREGSVLCAFALYKEGTLFDAKFLQVSGMRIHRATHYFVAYFDARVDAALLCSRGPPSFIPFSFVFFSLFVFILFYLHMDIGIYVLSLRVFFCYIIFSLEFSFFFVKHFTFLSLLLYLIFIRITHSFFLSVLSEISFLSNTFFFHVARATGAYLRVMIRLFRLSCQQRFRVGLHLGQHNRATRAHTQTRAESHSLSSPVFSRRPRRRRTRRRRRRKPSRSLSFAPSPPAKLLTIYRTRNAGHRVRTAQYTLYAPKLSNPCALSQSRDCSSFKVIDVLVHSVS